MASLWISPYVNIYWTKRFVRHRPCGLRGNLRIVRNQNKRIIKRDNLFRIKHKVECLRKPYQPKKPECKNFNSFYRSMQIPVRRK